MVKSIILLLFQQFMLKGITRERGVLNRRVVELHWIPAHLRGFVASTTAQVDLAGGQQHARERFGDTSSKTGLQQIAGRSPGQEASKHRKPSTVGVNAPVGCIPFSGCED